MNNKSGDQGDMHIPIQEFRNLPHQRSGKWLLVSHTVRWFSKQTEDIKKNEIGLDGAYWLALLQYG